ncbi:MAG: hypothetical protein ACI4S4_04370 [Candidatus Ornithospirochaeta sp.]
MSVPQPTVLAGQFADLIEANSLICLTDDGLSLSFSPRPDNVVRIVNSVRQDKKKFSYSNIKYRREDRWANAVKAVLYELSKAGIKIGGYNILIRGRGAGADSWSLTSSLFVGILLAMDKLEGLDLSKERVMEMSIAANSFCPNYQARKRDLWILLNAEEGMVYLWSEKKGAGEPLEYSDSSLRSYILSSSLPFQVLTPEEDEFRAKAKDVIATMAERNIYLSDIRAMSEKEARSIASRLPDVERRCLTHLVLDNECAVKAADALLRRDMQALGRTLFVLQRSVVENAELTSPEMDWIWRRGQEGEGVVGLCSIGLGIAGSFIAVVDDRASNLYARREEEYERIFGFRSSVRPFRPLRSPEAVRY